MKVKATLSFGELLAGECFTSGSGKIVKKKLADGKTLSVAKNGKVRTRRQKGNPKVRKTSCPLSHIGTGMRRHPETVVEIGDGRPSRVIRIVLSRDRRSYGRRAD